MSEIFFDFVPNLDLNRKINHEWHGKAFHEEGDLMQLVWGNGVIVIRDPGMHLEPLRQHKSLDLKWDDRIQAHCIPAYQYTHLKVSLRGKITLERDEIANSTNRRLIVGKVPELMEHQRKAFLAWKNAKCRGIVCLPTGTGKTILACRAIAELSLTTLVVVPTLVLLNQWRQVLTTVFGAPIGFIGDSHFELQTVTVITLASARIHAGRIGKIFGFVVFDEAHHLADQSLECVAKLLAAPSVLGLTATLPEDEERQRALCQILGPVVHRAGLKELVGRVLSDYSHFLVGCRLENDDLARFTCLRKIYEDEVRHQFAGSIEKDPLRIKKTLMRSERGRKALLAKSKAMAVMGCSSVKHAAISVLLRRNRGRRTLLFAASTEAAYALSARFLVPAITSEISKEEREFYLKHFMTGELPVIATCRVLNEGYDLPDAEIAILVSGSQGRSERVQRIGRVLRKREGKVARIFELVSLGTPEEFSARKRVKEGEPAMWIRSREQLEHACHS